MKNLKSATWDTSKFETLELVNSFSFAMNKQAKRNMGVKHCISSKCYDDTQRHKRNEQNFADALHQDYGRANHTKQLYKLIYDLFRIANTKYMN